MFGNNIKRPPEKGDGTILYVKEIFKTIQGEGPNVGMPAIFIRLGGCNLACSFCDTDFEDYISMSVDNILSVVIQASKGINHIKHVDHIKLVVITGGEPLRQKIAILCEQLLSQGFTIQIETNGTLYTHLPSSVQVVCSPKVVAGSYSTIHRELLPRVTAIKFLVSVTEPGYNTIPDLGYSTYNIPVFVQAMDEQDPILNKQNEDLAISIVINNGYRLSYQLHKQLGLQ